jgi:hypothetical protein
MLTEQFAEYATPRRGDAMPMAGVQSTPTVETSSTPTTPAAQTQQLLPQTTETAISGGRIVTSEAELFDMDVPSGEPSTVGSAGTISPEGEIEEMETDGESVSDEVLPMDDVVAQTMAPFMRRQEVSEGKFRWEFPETVSGLQERLQRVPVDTVGHRLLKQVGKQLSAAYGRSEQLYAQRAAWERRAEREVRKKEEVQGRMHHLQQLAETAKAEREALRRELQQKLQEAQNKADKNAARLMQHSVDVGRQLDQEVKLRGEKETENRKLRSQLASVTQDIGAAEEDYADLSHRLAEAEKSRQRSEEELQEMMQLREDRFGLQADLRAEKEENRILLLQEDALKARAEEAERANEGLLRENEQLAASADEARRRMDELRRKTRQTVLEKEQAEQQAQKERKATQEALTRVSQAEEAARLAVESLGLQEEKMKKENAEWVEREQQRLRRTFAIQTANHEQRMETLKAVEKAARSQDVAAAVEEASRAMAQLKHTQQLLAESRAEAAKLEQQVADVADAWNKDQQAYEEQYDELRTWGEGHVKRLTGKCNRQAETLKQNRLKIARLEKAPVMIQAPRTTPSPPPTRRQEEAREIVVGGESLVDVLTAQARRMTTLQDMVEQLVNKPVRPFGLGEFHQPVLPPPSRPTRQAEEPSPSPLQDETRAAAPAQIQVPTQASVRRQPSPTTTVEAVARAAQPIRVEEFKRDTSITTWIEETKAAARGRSWTEMRLPMQRALGTQRVEQIKAWSEDGEWPTNFQELEDRMREAFGPGDGTEQEKEFRSAHRGGMTYTQYVARLVNIARKTSWSTATALRMVREKLPEALQDKMYSCTTYKQLLPIVKQYDEIYSKTVEGQVQAVQGQEHSKMRCFTCGGKGHTSKVCKSQTASGSPLPRQEMNTKARCYRCGEAGHLAARCQYQEPVCYTCKQPGHRTSQCSTRAPPTAQPPKDVHAETPLCLACGEKGHRLIACKPVKDLQKQMAKASKSHVRQVQQEVAVFPLGEKDQVSQ